MFHSCLSHRIKLLIERSGQFFHFQNLDKNLVEEPKITFPFPNFTGPPIGVPRKTDELVDVVSKLNQLAGKNFDDFDQTDVEFYLIFYQTNRFIYSIKVNHMHIVKPCQIFLKEQHQF